MRKTTNTNVIASLIFFSFFALFQNGNCEVKNSQQAERKPTETKKQPKLDEKESKLDEEISKTLPGFKLWSPRARRATREKWNDTSPVLIKKQKEYIRKKIEAFLAKMKIELFRKTEWSREQIQILSTTGKKIKADFYRAEYEIRYTNCSPIPSERKHLIRSRRQMFGIVHMDNKKSTFIWLSPFHINAEGEFGSFIENNGKVYLCTSGDSSFIYIFPSLVKGKEKVEKTNFSEKFFDKLVKNNHVPEILYDTEDYSYDFSLRSYFSDNLFHTDRAGSVMANGKCTSITVENGLVCFEIENPDFRIDDVIQPPQKGKGWIDMDKMEIVKVEEPTNPSREDS
jgi:hypothetical protein